MRKNNFKKIGLILVVLIVLIIIVALIWYHTCLSAIDSSSNETKIVEVSDGLGSSAIADLLKENGVIKNSLVMKIYLKLNHVTILQSGRYEISYSENLASIVNKISTGDVYNDSVKITFIEGKNMRWYAKTIAENTNNTEEDVFNLLEDEEYIDSLIEKYWFLTDEIKNDEIYYSLEGYLLPDTYTFDNKDVSVKEIFNVILNYTEKYFDTMKDQIESYQFGDYTLTTHQMLTIASMAELEAGTTEERAEVVGVFYNRIKSRMSLGSDVTTYYAAKKDMADGDLTQKELDADSPYNTRNSNMAGKIPIGPICNPSKSAIEATLDFKETDAYYFVADKNGKIYFTKNATEHSQIINKLKKEGLWYTY